jgi:hypothetical protein
MTIYGVVSQGTPFVEWKVFNIFAKVSLLLDFCESCGPSSEGCAPAEEGDNCRISVSINNIAY